MKTKICFLSILFILTTLLALPLPALADGIIIPEPPICRPPCPVPPPPPRETPYLTVQNHRVSVSIDHQAATTRVDQVFRNDSHWALEGTYIFPLPEDAAISEFSMWIDGEKVEGQLYTKEEARRIYDDIVRRRLDPALLEYIGRDLFQASIFPIEPGDTRRIIIEYTELLAVDNGLVKYVYPLSTEKFSAKPLEDVSVSVDIKSDQPIKAVYSPSHPVSVDRPGDYSALVGWEDRNALPTTDFALYYSLSPEDLGLSLLSYKNNDEDGFFTMLIAPSIETDEVIEKDVILILDTSGSMEGEKLAQAQDALTFVLDHLNPGDRFNVTAFSAGVRSFSNRPEPLSAVPEAKRFVENLRAEGSTDINRALLEAIASLDDDTTRPAILIFLTDGLPTSGVTEPDLILNSVDRAAPGNVRIFPFGVGDDVDTFLLDSLARELRGTSAYVRPGERVDEAVSGFYAKVSTPVLADIELSVDGVRIEESYPCPLPDLFAGTQLIVAGRYPQGGPASITLEGTINGRPQRFEYEDLTFARDGGQDFIPRLWATRKIGYLLNQIRLHGESKEAIDQIVKLSIRYGIITPYTSFLVEEPEGALTQRGRDEIIEMAAEEAEAEALAPSSGAAAVQKAVESMALESADMAAPMPTRAASAVSGDEGRAVAASTVATVGDKAFILRDGVWTDTTFDPDKMTTTPLPFASQQFMDLLAAHPEAAKYFALGERVIVVVDGRAYETTEADLEALAVEPASVEPAAVEPTISDTQPTPAASATEGAQVVPTEEGVSSAQAVDPAASDDLAKATPVAGESVSPDAASADTAKSNTWLLLGGIVVLALLMGGAGWLVMRRS
ncbi:MAG TPA: VWA domain-containing protein [Chloroflexi bacterium]|nr:VWA domain-containing protein [Chloroflexota bacterium]